MHKHVATLPLNEAVAETTSYPIAETQLEVWLASQQGDEANCAYNECSSLVICGALDTDALQRALKSVVRRHEMLRATFSADGKETTIHDQMAFEFAYADWSELSPKEKAKARNQAIREEGTTPFDLMHGPLLRVRLQKVSSDQHLLTFTAHHIVMDGWSLWLFCRDLGHFYDAEVTGSPVELPKAQTFREYAAAIENYHAGEEGAADEQYWLGQFAESLPVLDLPTDRPRPALKTFKGDRYDHVMSAQLVSELRKRGGKAGCSLFHTMLAAFQVFLHRITRETDICVGIPTAGQNATDLHDVLGHCVNSLPIRTSLDAARPFCECVQEVRGVVLDAMDHQRYTFGTLLRKLAPPRDPSRAPIFQVMFNIDPEINSAELGFTGLETEVVVEPRLRENFDWFINGVIRQDGSIELQCQYNTDLFDRESMATYFESYEALLSHAAVEPTTAISDLRLLSRSQAQQMIVDWNATALEYPVDSTLHAEFARQASETPHAMAVEFGPVRLTYGQLDQQSNQLARLLQTMSVEQGDLVGVCLDRSERLVETLMAVMKCGAGYVPLDPSYPDERLRYMCEHSKVRLVITHTDLRERAAAFGAPTFLLNEQGEALTRQSTEPIELGGDPSDVAYVIYTSGSTGEPKGVQVPHGAVLNFLYSMRAEPGFTATDRLMAVTTPSFDISVLEFFLPLITGGQTVVADTATLSSGSAMGRMLEDANITIFQATPATWRMLIESGWEGRPGLKALCGGEPMPVDLVPPLLERVDELWNMYGPTETTVWSSIYRVKEAQQIFVGRPIGNTQIYILDEKMKPLPTGVAGELFIGGAGVTRGYLHRDDLTSERFVDNAYFNPFTDYINHRLYRTGDLGRFKRDGNIEFLRRNDKQVKVRGFRIELGEIEHRLRTHPGISQAIVVVHGTDGDSRLVAYLIPELQGLIASELRAHLREALPHYMIPQHFVEMEAFPKTNNGKIDYKLLPAPDGAVGSDVEYVAPESSQEVLLAQIWSEELEVEAVGVNDNFFSLGGHSLLVMKVISRVEDETGARLSPQDFLMGTLEQLAMMLPGGEEELVTLEQATVSETGAAKRLLGALKGLWT